MPYIRTEEVAAKRKAFKEAFPEYKFSIVRHHHSSINVTILQSPINFFEGAQFNPDERKYIQVPLNKSTIKENWKGEAQEALLKMYDILESNNRTVTQDADYGSIPQFYTRLSIGDYERECKII
jgi:hypothetical protein